MKMLPFLLINAVMVGGGIFAYDHLRPDADAGHAVAGDPIDALELENRIVQRLKGDEAPVLRASGADPRLLQRLEDLEARLGSKPAPARHEDSGEVATERDPGLAMPSLSEGDEVEPTEDEVKRFRKIMERAEQLRREEREMERMQQMLTRLEIDLDPVQQKKLLKAQREHRTKMGETMRTAFQAGGGREAAREAMEGLREEFTVVLTKFMSIGDAQKITEGGGMRGFGGFRGRDGGGVAATGGRRAGR